MASPKRFTAPWPRYFCPYCGAELRSSNRSLRPSLGFFATQMAFAPDGTLYVIDATARLRTIDKVTGTITDLGPISGIANGPYGLLGDLAFAPDGTAYVATYGSLYSLDVTTRTATTLHTNMFGSTGQAWLGLAFCDGNLYGSHVDPNTYRSSVFEIDLQSGARSLVIAMPAYATDLTSCSS